MYCDLRFTACDFPLWYLQTFLIRKSFHLYLKQLIFLYKVSFCTCHYRYLWFCFYSFKLRSYIALQKTNKDPSGVFWKSIHLFSIRQVFHSRNFHGDKPFKETWCLLNSRQYMLLLPFLHLRNVYEWSRYICSTARK